MTTPPAAFRDLLANTIDYAGLFPPANLSLEAALRNYAGYLRCREAWLLGAFVLPVTQFDAATPHLALFDAGHPLRVSALGAQSKSGDEFRRQLGEIVRAIAAFSGRHSERVRVDQIEMPLPPGADADLFRDAENMIVSTRCNAFWEAPLAGAAAAIEAIAQHRVRHQAQVFGFKLRTGGTVADAFPSPMQVAEILVAAAKHNVPVKFTAGLHHPMRHFSKTVNTRMHGFLNVLGAGMLAREHAWDVSQTNAMLADENPASFRFFDAGLTWRDWRIPTDRIVGQRPFITSFGSCSFDEPREDLRALNLL